MVKINLEFVAEIKSKSKNWANSVRFFFDPEKLGKTVRFSMIQKNLNYFG